MFIQRGDFNEVESKECEQQEASTSFPSSCPYARPPTHRYPAHARKLLTLSLTHSPPIPTKSRLFL
ncbi:hypothetical protein E2C01_066556 [Portunus trituberculatus]|uniref:Uncharacterized protein n=1 Tax=Portunus trituberculatus TaxID=210409 RepID=A0A5B7HU53_PORTR|nr:hypothetical protein [Portunus trituberculatus]